MERSKRDPSHIAQLVFDEESLANKVKLTDTEINIELSHKKDSVIAHPAHLVVSALGCTPFDNGETVIPALFCSSLREVRVDVDGTGSIRIMASPTDKGDFFYHVGGAGVVHKICARRIKVEAYEVKGDVHLVGRS